RGKDQQNQTAERKLGRERSIGPGERQEHRGQRQHHEGTLQAWFDHYAWRDEFEFQNGKQEEGGVKQDAKHPSPGRSDQAEARQKEPQGQSIKGSFKEMEL